MTSATSAPVTVPQGLLNPLPSLGHSCHQPCFTDWKLRPRRDRTLVVALCHWCPFFLYFW